VPIAANVVLPGPGRLGSVSVAGGGVVTLKPATEAMVRPKLNSAHDGQWTMTTYLPGSTCGTMNVTRPFPAASMTSRPILIRCGSFGLVTSSAAALLTRQVESGST
jgi:hypothetical protein